MKPISLSVFAFAAVVLISGIARADSIFDVEHARAEARAGSVSEDDEEYLKRWGGPSGYYPAPRYYDYDDDGPYRRPLPRRHRGNDRLR